MHALPIKPSRIYYRREKEPEQDFVKHCSPKAGPGAAKPRPASPSKRATLLTASRVDTDTLQVGGVDKAKGPCGKGRERRGGEEVPGRWRSHASKQARRQSEGRRGARRLSLNVGSPHPPAPA